SGDVVPRLEAQAKAAVAQLTTGAGVRGEVVRRVHIELAIVVAPAAGAEACEGAEGHRAAGGPSGCAELAADVVGEDVELGGTCRRDVPAARPAECGHDRERRLGEV